MADLLLGASANVGFWLTLKCYQIIDFDKDVNNDKNMRIISALLLRSKFCLIENL